MDDAADRDREVLMHMEKKAKRHGIDPVVALAMVFVVLKATGLISWSWLWVLSPIWLTYLFFAAVFFTIYVICRRPKE